MKRLNKWMSLVVAMVIVIGMVGVQRVEAATAGFRLESPTFTNVTTPGEKLKKGDKFNIYVDLTTTGGALTFDYADIGNPEVVETVTGTSRAPVYMFGANSLQVSNLVYLGGGASINLSITAKVSGTGETVSNNVNFKLDVEEISDGSETLKLRDTSQISILAGTSQKVDVVIENTSNATVKKPAISVEVEGENAEGITIKEAKDFKVSSISPKSSSKASFEIEASRAVKAGNYTLKFNLAGTIETVSLRVTSEFMPPQLEFSLEGVEGIKAGVPHPIKIKVHNVGDSEAKQIKVELDGESELAIIGGSNVKFISKIGAKQSGYANFTVKVMPNSKQNMLPIKINYSYQDEIGKAEENKVQYVYIPLQGGASASGEVVISNIIGPSSTIGVDQSFNVKFTLAALQGNARNVSVSVSAEDPEAIVPRSQNLFMLPELAKGAKKQYVVNMSATSKAGNQSHPIRIEVAYDSVVDNEVITFKQYTSVNINNPHAQMSEEESKKGQPKVIVGEYKINPTIVKAGEEFELEIGFLNTNKLKSVHNLKANLTINAQGENDAGNVFTPVNASNTFYISDLSPGQMITKHITMYTIPNALPKTYQVQLELEYEDGNGTPITALENIGIPVEQTTKVDIAEIEMDMFTLGMPMPLNVSLYNTGKTTISNMMIYTEGEGFSVQDNKMFVGTFDKGSGEYYSPTIIPEMPGMLNGTIVVEYEEATGEMVQMRKDFEFEVMEMMDEFPDDMGGMPFPEEEKKSKLPIILGIIVVLAAGAATTFFIRKKRKKEETEIEFDLDE